MFGAWPNVQFLLGQYSLVQFESPPSKVESQMSQQFAVSIIFTAALRDPRELKVSGSARQSHCRPTGLISVSGVSDIHKYGCHGKMLWGLSQCTAVQESTVQCSILCYSAVPYSLVQCSVITPGPDQLKKKKQCLWIFTIHKNLPYDILVLSLGFEQLVWLHCA